MAHVVLDYKRGDTVVINWHGRISVETITGNATVYINADGQTDSDYEIDRIDPMMPHHKMIVNQNCIFRTFDEARNAI